MTAKITAAIACTFKLGRHCRKMLPREIIAVCLFWQFFHQSCCKIAYLKYSKLKAINWGLPLTGHKLNATPIATSKVTNHVKCMGRCGKTEGCVAINLGPSQSGERECEMLRATRYSLLVPISVEADWTYVGPKVQNRDAELLNKIVKTCITFFTVGSFRLNDYFN